MSDLEARLLAISQRDIPFNEPLTEDEAYVLLRRLEELERERIYVTHYDWTPRPGEELADLKRLLNRGNWSVPWVRGAISSVFERLGELEQALNEIHEYQCGCDSPGDLARCVARPADAFEVLNAGRNQGAAA